MNNIINSIKRRESHRTKGEPTVSKEKKPIQQQPVSLVSPTAYSSIMQNEQNQELKKKQNFKLLAQLQQAQNSTSARILEAQHQQLEMQKQQMAANLRRELQQREFAAVAPKETVQDNEQSFYADPKFLDMLNKIYLSIPPQKRVNLAQLGVYLDYTPNLREYQGGFVDPNYDSQARPLGKDTNKITEF